jgi:hypothetical protein
MIDEGPGQRQSPEAEATRGYLVRDADGGNSIEIVLVAAVASILVIRAFLAATGYPQIGGHGLHIAHMLWGGFFMLVALLLLLTYWNPSLRRTAAFLGGIGFGTFIDELGKFITSDNDYFFRPTIALIYIIFMLLFLLARSMRQSTPLSVREIRLNEEIRRYLEDIEAARGSRFRRYFQLRDWLDDSYRRVVSRRWFEMALTAGFLIVGFGELLGVIGIMIHGRGGEPSVPAAQAASSAISTLCIWVGIWKLRSSRLAAYVWFERSVLVNLLVTQIFLFYDSQLAALGGLAVNLALYVALRYATYTETRVPRRRTINASRNPI